MDWGFGTPGGGQTINDFRSRNSKNKSEKSQVFFGENLALRKSCKNHFPMVRVTNIRSFSSFFFEMWALLKSFKNDIPMVREKISEVSHFFVSKRVDQKLFIFGPPGGPEPPVHRGILYIFCVVGYEF